MEVKREPGIDEFGGDDQGEEEHDGSNEYDIGGVLEEDDKKRGYTRTV